MRADIRKALEEAYRELAPFSEQYRVDFDRYAFSLSILLGIPEIQKKKILDIGTGVALMPLALSRLGMQAVGLDYCIFPEADNAMFGRDLLPLQEVWQKNGVVVHKGDIYRGEYPKDTGPFDVIISECTIEHLKDPKKFLSLCKDILPRGGYLLITTPNATSFLKRLRVLFGKSPNWPIKDFFADGEAFTGHWREYTVGELCYMCEQSGFVVSGSWNKNLLTKFKPSLGRWRKNILALITAIGTLVPGGGEMNFILCRKPDLDASKR